jgi:lipoprotein signal peptidase
MSNKNKDIWFPSKKYGIGWGLPSKWQGWVVLIAYLILTLAGTPFIKSSPAMIIPYLFYTFLLTGGLVFICWKKGEKIDFRWSKKE